ncbi:MAG: NAD-dependent deacetylase [Candidatus Delongbacteria bacterium]|jgi:NAD-dependent deacetylase|nr:NAD-dependent deacetylase [Candidatus Delongbacteria bacterium]
MSKILILSGAGLSAESDIRTFRSNNGIWEEHNVMEVCSVEGFISDREKVLNFYDQRRKDIENKIPNDAHKMISELKTKYMNEVTVFTQNVDDLLEKADCPDVFHLHGKLRELECEMCGCKFDIEYKSIKEIAECPECKSHALRHNVVMFGEPAPMYQRLYNVLIKADLLVIIGTSGEVLPVSEFASYTKYSILNNLEHSLAINHMIFTHTFYERATTAAPKIKCLIEKFIETGEI